MSRDDLLAGCVFRQAAPYSNEGSATCGLIRRLAGSSPRIAAHVCREACVSCLERPPAGPGRVNSVVASVLHGAIAAARIPQGQVDFESAELRFLQDYAARQLDRIGADGTRTDDRTDQIPPSREAATKRGGRILRWLAAVRGAAQFNIAGRRDWPSIGLVGWNVRTGLGYQNRGIAAHIPLAKWLIPRHPSYGRLRVPLSLRSRAWLPRDNPSPHTLRQWLAGLEWLLFVETPLIPGLAKLAKEAGLRVACVCNWELSCPATSAWLQDVDLVICPTRYTLARLQDWKQRFGFTWKLTYVAWPIDDRHIRFRQRDVCRRLVFVNGRGGCRGSYSNGQATPYRRKGLELLFAAARIARHVPIIVYSQGAVPPPPANVEIRRPPADNSVLYKDGDVCIQPSHWEGLGLPLLECQAAGMPLITTDAPPMNEHNPFRTVPLSRVEPVYLAGAYPVPSRLMDPRDLAETLASVFHSPVAEASQQARRFIETEHAWPVALQLLQRALQPVSESFAQ